MRYLVRRIRNIVFGVDLGRTRRYLVLAILELSLLGAVFKFAQPRLEAWLNPPPTVLEPAGVQKFEDEYLYIDVTNIRTNDKVIYVIVELIGDPTSEDSTAALLGLVAPYEQPGHINLVIKFIKPVDGVHKFYWQNTLTLTEMRAGIKTPRGLRLNNEPLEPDDLRWKG